MPKTRSHITMAVVTLHWDKLRHLLVDYVTKCNQGQMVQFVFSVIDGAGYFLWELWLRFLVKSVELKKYYFCFRITKDIIFSRISIHSTLAFGVRSQSKYPNLINRFFCKYGIFYKQTYCSLPVSMFFFLWYNNIQEPNRNALHLFYLNWRIFLSSVIALYYFSFLNQVYHLVLFIILVFVVIKLKIYCIINKVLCRTDSSYFLAQYY